VVKGKPNRSNSWRRYRELDARTSCLVFDIEKSRLGIQYCDIVA
jgi:hypothetical protein